MKIADFGVMLLYHVLRDCSRIFYPANGAQPDGLKNFVEVKFLMEAFFKSMPRCRQVRATHKYH